MLSSSTAAAAVRRAALMPPRALRPAVGGAFAAAHRRGLSNSSSSVTTLSDLDAVDRFTQLNSKCVVYYTATWCGPCKAIKPVYEQTAIDNPNVALGKVDVDDNPEAAAAASISAVPTFVSYHNNETIQEFAGADQTKLAAMVTELNERK